MSHNGMSFWQKLKRPRGFFLVLLYLVTLLACTGAILSLFWKNAPQWVEFFRYFLYALAALTLGYSVYTIVIYAPGLKSRIIAAMKRIPLVARMLENYGFRTVLAAGVSLLINLVYAVFNGVVALYSLSIWYGALAGYYILLTVLRSRLVLYHRKVAKGALEEAEQGRAELSRYRFCGIALIAMPLCLSFAILQMVVSDRGYAYMGLTIYVVATYTFYKITMAIINVVRARKNHDLTIEALRNVGLADAMVSILALQTAMFHSFGEGVDADFANALTGGGICALTVAMGIYMLIRARSKTKEMRDKNGTEAK